MSITYGLLQTMWCFLLSNSLEALGKACMHVASLQPLYKPLNPKPYKP